MIARKNLKFFALLLPILASASSAWATGSIARHYTVEKTAMKCAARLAIVALSEGGFPNQEMNAAAFSISKNHFEVRVLVGRGAEMHKILGFVDLNITPRLNSLDEPSDEVGCGIAGNKFAQITLRDETNHISVLDMPVFLDKEIGEDKCFFISGLKGDSIGAFDPYLVYLRKKQLVLGENICKTVGSWALFERDLSFQAELADCGLAPRIRRVMILNGAHGNSGGDVGCDAGDEKGTTVLETLVRVSRRYPTTAIIDSCFSGDMVARKLLFDRAHPDDESIKNLCLMTDAPFSYDAIEASIHNKVIPTQISNAPQKLYSGFDYFKRIDQLALISGSPWQASGAVSMLARKVTPDNPSEEAFTEAKRFLPRSARGEQCWKIMDDLRTVLQSESEFDSYDGKIHDLSAAEDLIHQIDIHPECHANPIANLLLIFTKVPNRLSNPKAMKTVLEAMLWTNEDFDIGDTPFNPIARDWSLKTMGIARNNRLDKLRSDACAFR